MQNLKDNIRRKLLETGRRLVSEKGVEYLTARKLSEASECSIGTLYNQFDNMDDFVAEQNEQTLAELAQLFAKVVREKSAYANLNAYLDCWLGFMEHNRQLWFLLYGFHLNTPGLVLSFRYKKYLLAPLLILRKDFATLTAGLSGVQKKLSLRVLAISLFAVSSLLVSGAVDMMQMPDRKNLCRLLLNTYLAGAVRLKGK